MCPGIFLYYFPHFFLEEVSPSTCGSPICLAGLCTIFGPLLCFPMAGITGICHGAWLFPHSCVQVSKGKWSSISNHVPCARPEDKDQWVWSLNTPVVKKRECDIPAARSVSVFPSWLQRVQRSHLFKNTTFCKLCDEGTALLWISHFLAMAYKLRLKK